MFANSRDSWNAIAFLGSSLVAGFDWDSIGEAATQQASWLLLPAIALAMFVYCAFLPMAEQSN